FGVVIQLSGNGSVITVQALDDQNLQSEAVSYDTGHPVLRVEAVSAAPVTVSGPVAVSVEETPTAPTAGTAMKPEPVRLNTAQVSILIWTDPQSTHIEGEVTGDFPIG